MKKKNKFKISSTLTCQRADAMRKIFSLDPNATVKTVDSWTFKVATTLTETEIHHILLLDKYNAYSLKRILFI